MGRSCSVPGCVSNYGNQVGNITTFAFPKDSVRRHKWLRSINRADWTPGKTACVCIKHFAEHFIIREDVAKRKDGTELRVQRKIPTLTTDAYPSIFLNQPSYLSSNPPTPRTEPSERRTRLDKRDELFFQDYLENDKIESFKTFVDTYAVKLQCELSGWSTVVLENCVHFYQYNCNLKKVDVAIVIRSDFYVKVFSDGNEVSLKKFSSFLGKNFICDSWMKFENLLNHFKFWKYDSTSVEDMLEFISSLLKKCIKKVKCRVCDDKVKVDSDSVCECGEKEENTVKKLVFLHEQLWLLMQKRPVYSPETLIWAFSIYLGNQSSYCDIRDSQVLTLPHPMYLKKFSQKMGPNQSGLNASHTKYLKEKCKLLEDHEKLVIVMLDEISVKGRMSYKGGRIEGRALNRDEPATAIQAFMLSSIFSKNRDVVALFPVKNQSAINLLEFLKQVLTLLNDCGYQVFALISDNHRCNRSMYISLGGGVLSTKVKNPVSPNQEIFLLFDSVHLLKTIRNNWLNQSDKDKTFVFPNFVNHEVIEYASLQDLRDIYRNEANDIVKVAPALSQKVLYPSSTERQNVQYAVRLFDEKTIAVLEKKLKAQGSKMFLEVILKWWSIVNVKNPTKGVHKRDVYQEPINSTGHDSYLFLEKFETWLKAWNALQKISNDPPSRFGKLTVETQTALSHTVTALREIVKCLLLSNKTQYVLLGKFQTDNLEARFGQYRQLSGSNYLVSVDQILESEKKLKLLGIVKLRSAQKGDFELKDFFADCAVSTECDFSVEIENHFISVINEADYVDVSTKDLQALVFIAGYVSRGALKDNQCVACHDFLINRNDLMETEGIPEEAGEYLKIITRGGLKCPTDFSLKLCINAFQVFQTLISADYESSFILAAHSQKQMTIKLCVDRFKSSDMFINISCECGVDLETFVVRCSVIMTNILLNNYTKVQNNLISINSYNTNIDKIVKKRKIAALNSQSFDK